MEQIKYGRKRKGIKKELNKKIEDWLNSIDDKEVQDLARKNTIVTGGSIASMLLGEPVNDFDIYFRDIKTAKAIAEYYVNQFKVNNPDLLLDIKVLEEDRENIRGAMERRVVVFVKSDGIAEDKLEQESRKAEEEPEIFETITPSMVKETRETLDQKYRPVFLSENAITLTNKIQLIIRFYGEPDQIHNNYDFVHATCYWDHHKQHLELPSDALEALLSRTLTYKGSLYPIASIFRAKKFIERGWRITAGELLKIMWQISELNLKDMNTLRDQLTGVDMVYMYNLLTALKSTDKDKLNSTYVAEIIDKIFE